MKILILGASGMLGSATFKVFSSDSSFTVYATARNSSVKEFFNADIGDKIIPNVDVLDNEALVDVFARVKPDIVVNCVGLIKQLANADNPLVALPINSMLPHRLLALCKLIDARLIHISTDCVFSGGKGNYIEQDISDAYDLYGKSKYIGELHNDPNAITLRTSIIGHELSSNYALIDWFLAQKGQVNGFKHAIFSGLPTNELATVIKNFVVPNEKLSGLFHVSSDPISKFDLLELVANEYKKNITIIPDTDFKIDRSLNSDKFRALTGYKPAKWQNLISAMSKFQINK